MSTELNSDYDDEGKQKLKLIWHMLKGKGKLETTRVDEDNEFELIVTVEGKGSEETYYFTEEDIMDGGYYYEFIQGAIGSSNLPYVVQILEIDGCEVNEFWVFDEAGRDVSNEIVRINNYDGKDIEVG